MNADGQTHVAAAVLILKFVVGIQELTLAQLSAADVKTDCTVNVNDAVAILRKAVGLPVQ